MLTARASAKPRFSSALFNYRKIKAVVNLISARSGFGDLPHLGPSVLLQSYRWMIEPLDTDLDKRLAMMENSPRLNMYLNPGLQIKNIKKEVQPSSEK
eukprot:gene18856-47184_t